VIFTAALYQPGQERVENGTLASVVEAEKHDQLTIQTQRAQSREVRTDTEEFNDLRLSYAQHVYKAQGRTVDRALVLTGGWQTDRERAYVALTRARDRTDLYVSREDLGEQGMDAGAIERFGDAMAESHPRRRASQHPSLTTAVGQHQKPNDSRTAGKTVRARRRRSCASPSSATTIGIWAAGSNECGTRRGRGRARRCPLSNIAHTAS
jgi:hypothetical protein